MIIIVNPSHVLIYQSVIDVVNILNVERKIPMPGIEPGPWR